MKVARSYISQHNRLNMHRIVNFATYFVKVQLWLGSVYNGSVHNGKYEGLINVPQENLQIVNV